ncbi:MAG: glycosyltransferase [Alphaproteobacteria bacterium]|nr:glycosyltransferase [Alphaproteobacteria bacterium]
MRVAQVMAGAAQGGAEGFYERLVPALARGGIETLAVIRADAARAARLHAAGLAPVELGFGGPLDLFTRPRLKRALAAFAPAVVVAWMNRAARFTPQGPWVLAGRLGGFYDLKYYRHCAHLIGNTRTLCRWIEAQGWEPARVHYLPNFAADATEAAKGAAPIARASLDTPHDAPLLLGLGRLHRNKAFDVLIEAMARLPGAHLWLAGEGPERGALAALAERLGVAPRLRFLGWREDVAALLAACDLFVCPSRHEPLGNVVLEAWSAGRAVVAAASDGPAELIEDGRTGLLVPAERPGALADAIAALLADPARAAAIGAAGRTAYLARFTEAAVVARWRDFLAAVSAGTNAGTR